MKASPARTRSTSGVSPTFESSSSGRANARTTSRSGSRADRDSSRQSTQRPQSGADIGTQTTKSTKTRSHLVVGAGRGLKTWPSWPSGSFAGSRDESASYRLKRRSFSIGCSTIVLAAACRPTGQPTLAMRSGMVRSVNVRGPTSPRSTSSHVHGADTGAPRFARTVYAAANVAL